MAQADARSITRRPLVAAATGAAPGRSDPTRDALARNVRMLRAAQRISQLDLAAEAEIAAGAVSTIEAGKANPTVASLARIARALGVDMAALFADRLRKT